MPKLSQHRAADRLTMANQVREIAERHGFTAEMKPAPLNDRGLCVVIRAARGLMCSMQFQPEAEGPRGWGFLGHWHTDTGSTARLSMAFGAVCGGTVNQFHQQKATTHGGEDFAEFCSRLDRALVAVAAGECWDSEFEHYCERTQEDERRFGGRAFLPPDLRFDREKERELMRQAVAA